MFALLTPLVAYGSLLVAVLLSVGAAQLFFWFVRKMNPQPEQVRIEDQDLLLVFGHDSRSERR
jgi:hypothetical protein